MKNPPKDLKVLLDRLAAKADTNTGTHPKCAGQRTIHHRNRKARHQRVEKKPLQPNRIRKIIGSFAFIEHRFLAFIEHRFLRQGFWSSLSHHELLLYLFLVIVADRNGLSYYCYTVDEYILARDLLIDKDLIAFDGRLFQVLSLPQTPPSCPTALKTAKDMQTHDPATIHQLITHCFGKKT
jgi:hypothetical protein